VHSRPGFVLTRATTRSRFFYNRQVNNSVQVSALPLPTNVIFPFSAAPLLR
jgi:hypothetical protein